MASTRASNTAVPYHSTQHSLHCTTHRSAARHQHSPAQCLEPTQSRAEAGAKQPASYYRLCSTFVPCAALLIHIHPASLPAIPNPQHHDRHHRHHRPTPPLQHSCHKSSLLLPMWPSVSSVSGVLQTFGDLPEVPDHAVGGLASSWLPAPSSRHGETLGSLWVHVPTAQPTHPSTYIHILTHLISSTMTLEHRDHRAPSLAQLCSLLATKRQE